METRHLIVGLGEIGKAVHAIFPGQVVDIKLKSKAVQRPIDIMHICFPYSPKFVQQVKDYQNTFYPEHTIIYSTVAIGTTKQIPDAVHSPVEGRHPDLELSIRTMTRWIGANDPKEGQFFANLFEEKHIKIRGVHHSDFTEFLKLRSTAKYGINLIWTDYEKSVVDAIDMDFRFLKEFDSDYNKLYDELGEDWAKRYILDPPGGVINGHCIIPNAKLLNEQFPNDWVEKLASYE